MREQYEEGPSNRAYLDDPAVRAWYETKYLSSEHTADNYLTSMGRVWRLSGLSPLEFVQGEQREIDIRAQMILNRLHSYRQRNGEPLSHGSLKAYRDAMGSWLDWNGAKFNRIPNIGRAPKRPRARKTQIPGNESLDQVLQVAPLRTKASICLEAFSACRPEVQGSKYGDRGLVMENITGLARDEEGKFIIDHLPLKIEVPDEISKTGEGYDTFMGGQGAEILVMYFNYRLEQGENIGPDSPVILAIKSGNRKKGKKFLQTKSIREAIQDAHDTVNLNAPPYIWRSYFKSFMEYAQLKKVVVKDHYESWMGHTEGVSKVYSVGKRLPPAVQEAMEESYMKAVRYLETRRNAQEEDGAKATIEAILKGLNVPEEELAQIDFADPDPGRIEAVIKTRVAALEQAPAPVSGANGAAAQAAPSAPLQRLVAVDEVGAWMEEGWTYVYQAQVPPGMALIESTGAMTAGAMTAPAAASVTA